MMTLSLHQPLLQLALLVNVEVSLNPGRQIRAHTLNRHIKAPAFFKDIYSYVCVGERKKVHQLWQLTVVAMVSSGQVPRMADLLHSAAESTLKTRGIPEVR